MSSIASAAAGDTHAAELLRARTASLAERAPSYYGDAWAALGPALLDRSIDPCTEPAGGELSMAPRSIEPYAEGVGARAGRAASAISG